MHWHLRALVTVILWTRLPTRCNVESRRGAARRGTWPSVMWTASASVPPPARCGARRLGLLGVLFLCVLYVLSLIQWTALCLLLLFTDCLA